MPANAVATIGQTSLLGSMHVALDPPPGRAERPARTGVDDRLNRSSTYPSTEQTLSSLSVVINAGGFGQIGDVIHGAATAFSGREQEIRELISRLNNFVGTVDEQRDRFAAAIQALNRLTRSGGPEGDITGARRPSHRPSMCYSRNGPSGTALQKLGQFSDTATQLVNSAQANLVHNLANLEPTLKALADIGP